ncbi:MAG: YCF48-related protein [Ignavibacteriae bacterium]|nr:YCF48-related protein [Ignavibacteriota bacterium]
MRRILLLILLVNIFCLTSSAQVVKIPLVISNGNSFVDSLFFGLDPTATNGIDPALGESQLPPLPPTGAFDARFIGTNIVPPLPIGEGLLRDYRQGSIYFIGTKIHQIRYQAAFSDTVSIIWNLPPGVTGRIYDVVTGNIINDTMYNSGILKVVNHTIFSSLFMRINYSLLGIPALISPPSGSINAPVRPFLYWSEVTGAASYRLQVSTDSLFANVVFDSSGIRVSGVTVPKGKLIYLTKYYWRVAAVNSYGQSGYSNKFNFTTIFPPPPAPNLFNPVNGSINVQINNLNFNWSKPYDPYMAGNNPPESKSPERYESDNPFIFMPDEDKSVSKYWFEMASDTMVLNNLIRDSLLTDTNKSVSGLINYTSYYWRVKAKNLSGWGSFSPWNKFRTISWLLLASGTSNVLKSVHFEDANTGFVVGDSATVLKTTNGGINWTPLNPGTTHSLSSVFFTDVNTGYVAGDMGVILKTTNGGTNWFALSSGTTNMLQSLFFTSAGTGYASGSGGIIIKTVNSGATWAPLSSGTSQWLNSIFFSNASSGYIVGDSGTVIKTINAGASWVSQTSTVNKWLSAVQFPASNTGYSVGYNGTIIKTVNGGANWISQASNTTKWLRALYFPDVNTGYAVGDSAVFLKTTNGGNIWIAQTASQKGFEWLQKLQERGTGLTSIYFPAPNIGYSAGNDGVIFKTVLLEIPVVPVPVSPANLSVGNVMPVTLNWNKSDRTETYSLQVSTDSLFNNIILNDSTVTDTSQTLNNLSILTRYYWHLKAINQGGESDFSAVWSFRTIGLPNMVNLIYPPDNSVNLPFNLNFVWNKPVEQTFGIKGSFQNVKIGNSVKGSYAVSNYWFELTTDTVLYTGIVKDSLLVDTNKFVTGLQILTKYFWRVKAKNEAGWGNFTAWNNFTTIIGAPSAPVLVYPANHEVGIVPSVTLDWDDAQGAETYRVQVSADSLFASLIINVAGLPVSEYNVPDRILAVLSNYFWRVSSTNAAGTSIYSDVFKFRTMGLPLTVNPVSPVNNSINIAALNTVFKWNRGLDQTLSKTGNNGKELNSKNTEKTGNDLRTKNTATTGTNAETTVKNIGTTGTDELTMVSKYWFELVTDTSSMAGLLQDTAIADTTKIISSLNNITDYYFRVKGRNEIGWGGFSAWYKFTTTVALPSLLTPANNSVDVSLSPALTWSTAATAITYDLQVSADTGFSALLYDLNGLPLPNYTVPVPLNIFTYYYWRVRATNSNGTSPYYSSPFTFRTVPNAPLSPALVSPSNNSTGLLLPVVLQWSKVNDASSYRLQVATDAAFTALVFNDSTLTDTSKVIPGLQPVTTYYWRVNSKNIAGTSAYSGTWNFRALGAPNPVTLLIPPNGAVNQPVSLTFVWSIATEPVTKLLGGIQGSDNSKQINDKGKSVTENGKSVADNGKSVTDDPLVISKYFFELTSDTVTFTGIYRDSTTTDTTLSVGGLLTGRDYFWRVKARNQVGNGMFTVWFRFTTISAIPTAPVLTAPANNSTGVSLTPAISWSAVTGAASYRLQVSTDSLFATTQFDTSGVTGTTVTVPVNKLTGLTKYYWRVNATNVSGTGPYSAVWNFRTLQNLALNLKVYLEGFWDGSTQVSDTTMVYLANITTPYAFVDSVKIILSASGTSSLNFSKAPNGNYYIVVNHRNHLETWSKLPQAFVTNISVAYDFSTSASQAFGDNMKQIGTVWVLYGGDANRDGSIDALDVALFIVQFGNSGYLSCDFNGDGSVDALDVPIIVANFGLGKAVPTLDIELPGNIRKQKVIEEIQTKYKLNGESEKKETFKQIKK